MSTLRTKMSLSMLVCAMLCPGGDAHAKLSDQGEMILAGVACVTVAYVAYKSSSTTTSSKGESTTSSTSSSSASNDSASNSTTNSTPASAPAPSSGSETTTTGSVSSGASSGSGTPRTSTSTTSGAGPGARSSGTGLRSSLRGVGLPPASGSGSGRPLEAGAIPDPGSSSASFGGSRTPSTGASGASSFAGAATPLTPVAAQPRAGSARSASVLQPSAPSTSRPARLTIDQDVVDGIEDMPEGQQHILQFYYDAKVDDCYLVDCFVGQASKKGPTSDGYRDSQLREKFEARLKLIPLMKIGCIETVENDEVIRRNLVSASDRKQEATDEIMGGVDGNGCYTRLVKLNPISSVGSSVGSRKWWESRNRDPQSADEYKCIGQNVKQALQDAGRSSGLVFVQSEKKGRVLVLA